MATITINEVRRGLADCRRQIRAAEGAIAAADVQATYAALERLQHAAFDTSALLQHGGRYVPADDRQPVGGIEQYQSEGR